MVAGGTIVSCTLRNVWMCMHMYINSLTVRTHEFTSERVKKSWEVVPEDLALDVRLDRLARTLVNDVRQGSDALDERDEAFSSDTVSAEVVDCAADDCPEVVRLREVPGLEERLVQGGESTGGGGGDLFVVGKVVVNQGDRPLFGRSLQLWVRADF